MPPAADMRHRLPEPALSGLVKPLFWCWPETVGQSQALDCDCSPTHEVGCCMAKHGPHPVWVAVVPWVIRLTANG